MAKQKTVKDLVNYWDDDLNNEPIMKYNTYLYNYRNKYFNLFISQFKWDGITKKQENYIMRKFYAEGTVSAGKIKNLDELFFTQYAVNEIDMYDQPEEISFINKKNVPFIPSGKQVVDKDAVIGYAQHNHKSISSCVDWYIQRIAQIEMVINTNLQLHKIPFLVPIEPEDKKKAVDILNRILNNELVVFTDIDPSTFQAIQTQVPYIIDKLYNYKLAVENELKTYLGINNDGTPKIEQLQLSEVNANNEEINDSENNFLANFKSFCDDIKDVFGITISVDTTSKPVEYMGQEHNYEEQPGPKENNEEEE